MYVSVIASFICECIFFSSIILVLYSFIIFIAFKIFIKYKEELRFKRDFGAEYLDYCIKVRRWF